MSGRDAPLVIAGTGGSGTRILLRIACHTGRFMGEEARLNAEGDAKELMPFANRWIRPYCRARLRDERPADWLEMCEELEQRLARHRAALPDVNARWGWKQPRSIYFIPLYDEMFPEMHFLHVVRDGRDFAEVLKKDMVRIEDLLLDTELLSLPRPLRVVALWARINELAADYGEQAIGDRYLRVTLEELLTEPDAALARVLPFMGWDGEPTDAMRAEIGPMRSLARWRSLEPDLREQVTAIAMTALMRFGYTVESEPAPGAQGRSPRGPVKPASRVEKLERRLEDTEHRLEVMTHARARAEEQHDALLDELADAVDEARRSLERTQASRAWRWGHRLTRAARMLILRPSGRTSALEEAAVAVERIRDTVERRER